MRPRIFTFEHGDLLAQGEDLQTEIVARTKEGTQVGQKRKRKLEHRNEEKG